MDYIVVSTSKCDYQAWQLKLLYWSIKKSKQKGKLILDFNFDIFRPFKNGYACVGVKNGITELWGIIDDSGKLICDIKYTNVTNFNELYACVCKKISTSYNLQ